MIKFSIHINNKIGLHLRAAGEFVKVASRYTSDITVFKDGKKANGKSILGLASLAVPNGALITIRIKGPDELEAREALEALISSNFNEE